MFTQNHKFVLVGKQATLRNFTFVHYNADEGMSNVGSIMANLDFQLKFAFFHL
jgi:hypothetical protein